MMDNAETNLVVNETVSVPLSEIRFEFVRSSGPGGQNVNKVNSQAQLYWDVVSNETLPIPVRERLLKREANRVNKVGVLRIDCQTSRDREKNRLECLNRLREMLVQACVVPVTRKKKKPPRWVKERRLRNKKEKSKVKQLRRPPSRDHE